MQIISQSASNTVKIGTIIAKNLKPSDIICLFGELGSGKTVLTKGIAKGLGIPPGEVTSPSFVLLRIHNDARPPLYHFDLYRLKNKQDILELGYEEYLFGAGVTVIEWADRLKKFLPQEFFRINLSLLADSRRLIKFSAYGSRYKELLKDIDEDIRH